MVYDYFAIGITSWEEKLIAAFFAHVSIKYWFSIIADV